MPIWFSCSQPFPLKGGCWDRKSNGQGRGTSNRFTESEIRAPLSTFRHLFHPSIHPSSKCSDRCLAKTNRRPRTDTRWVVGSLPSAFLVSPLPFEQVEEWLFSSVVLYSQPSSQGLVQQHRRDSKICKMEEEKGGKQSREERKSY